MARIRKHPADQCNGAVLASRHFRFAMWAMELGRAPKASAVALRFSVSDSTAKRLVAAWNKVVGGSA